MKVEETVETFAKFFNDLIGALIPGTVLMFGLIAMHAGPALFTEILKVTEGAVAALTLAGLLFALGHAVSALYEHSIKPILSKLNLVKGFDKESAQQKQSYKWFSSIVSESRSQNGKESLPEWNYFDLRSVALSVSSEAASLGRRFMFISLLCNGVACALIVIGVDFILCVLAAPMLLHSYDQAAPWLIQALLIFGVAALLIKRGEVFYERAMTTPFAVAVAELKFQKDANVVSAT